MSVVQLYNNLVHIRARHLIDPLNGDFDFEEYFLEIKEGTKNIVDVNRQHILFQLARGQLGSRGSFAEFGVYQGGTAYLLSKLVGDSKRLYLFDTFSGMPECDDRIDYHREGEFGDTSLLQVQEFIGVRDNLIYREGFFPDTTEGIEDEFSFVHIDTDIYRSILDGCHWFYDRMLCGGVMVFDDYGLDSCPGVKKAVDEFFLSRPEFPVYLPMGQCFVVKTC